MADSERPRTVLVTGAARGLGYHMAQRFHRAGNRVVLADLDAAAVMAASKELRGEAPEDTASGIAVDVTDDRSVADLAGELRDRFGTLDVLVNNAGVISRAPAQEFPTERWQQELDVNLGGTFRCSRACFDLLARSSRASVINMASVGSTFGMPLRAGYTAAKSGVLGLTRTLAAEWGAHGVRVNAIAPGFMDTTMTRTGLASGVLDESMLTSRIPLGRLGTAEEVAGTAEFLASDAAAYITGTVVKVDGGMTIDGTFFNNE